MGATFSSNQLAAAPSDGVPTLSYAYSSGNTKLFGVDATYTYDAFGFSTYTPVGYITPYLIPPSAAPTITCAPFYAEQSSQSLLCPVTGASLASGLYTISFSQYLSTSTVGPDQTTTYFQSVKTDGPNTLTNFGGDATFSIVPPQATGVPAVTITPTPSVTTTITSGVSEVPATATDTVPATIKTVTVYATTIVSTSSLLSTLSGASLVTVTGTCSSKSSTTSRASSTLLVCNKDNCLRALINKSATASSFCSNYIATSALTTPTYASQCSGLASRVSSACSCIVTPTVASSATVRKARGLTELPTYAPPDFTYGGAAATVTASPVTVTSGPYPSATVTDPDSTTSFGTSTSTDNEASTVTVTVFQSTVDLRTVSTVTVAPTTCK